MKKLLQAAVILAALAIGGFTQTASAQTNSTQVNLLSNSIPPQISAQLPPGAAAFNPAGLSFTNVTYKVALGTEMVTGTGGTLTYAQGDIDAFNLGSFDIGFGTETTFSSSGSGLHSAAADIEGIKNLSNWQLVGKIGCGHNFEDNVGTFAELGFDVNYNLTAGASLSFLGTSAGAFTYVGAGADWSTPNLSFSQQGVEKKFRVYVGYAF